MRIFLFGEAEKGEFCTPFRLQSLYELSEKFGGPSKEGVGIEYAIQALLYEHELVFFRVHEEGFSFNEYMHGVKLLYKQGKNLRISAICMPGMGDLRMIEAIEPICLKLKTVLVLSEKDLYDYLTNANSR